MCIALCIMFVTEEKKHIGPNIRGSMLRPAGDPRTLGRDGGGGLSVGGGGADPRTSLHHPVGGSDTRYVQRAGNLLGNDCDP